MKFTIVAMLALLAAGPGVRPGQAQVLYGSVVGTIEDQSGGVVPNATVTITNKQTGLTRNTTADEAGRYSLLNVLPGRYDLKIAASGFKSLTRADVDVTINTVTRENIRLEVGAITEQVQVEATAVTLQTDKSDVRHEITGATIQNLPLPGYRNYQTLIALVPGTSPRRFRMPWSTRPAARCARS